MVKKHLKRLAMPKTWPIARKTSKRITRPMPAGHSFENGMPLNVILKDLLHYADTTQDVKNILKNKDIVVEGKIAKEYKQLVGLMDTISIPKTNESFRIVIDNKGKLAVIKIKKEESNLKIAQIKNKKMTQGKTQIGLHDGRTIMLAKDPGYKVGDSLIITVPDQEIKGHVKLDKNTAIFLTGGSHKGQKGTIEKIDGNKINLKTQTGDFETLKKFAFPIGKTKSELQIE